MSATKKSRHNATRSRHRQAAARRRRELAVTTRPRAAASDAPTRRRRGPVIAAVVALGAIVAGTIAVAVTRGDDAPEVTLNGALVASSAPEQVVGAPPTAYRIVYRLELESGQLFDEQLVVREPFDVRYRYADLGALDAPLLDYIQTEEVVTTTESATARSTRATGTLPLLAHRFDATLANLVEHGFYERRERRRVLDTECTVYRTGSVTESFTVTRATENVYADLCISDDGIVLEEVSVKSGKADMRVTATAVDRTPELIDADFPVSTDAATLLAGGIESSLVSTSEAPVTPYWRFTTAPEGWSHLTRRKLDATLSDGSAGPAVTRTSFVDTYTRGGDLLVVRQGATGTEPDSLSTTQAVEVDVAGFGASKLVLNTTGSTIAIEKDGRFLQVLATVPAVELTTLAAALTSG